MPNPILRRLPLGHFLLACVLLVTQGATQGIAPFVKSSVPSECHEQMSEFRSAGETILCVAFPPAGGNRWSIVTDSGFENRGIPAECHAEMNAMASAGEKILCVAFPPAGGNRWSIITDSGFENRGIPSACHDKMNELWSAGEKILCVAFPPAGGDRWSIITDSGFENRGIPSACHDKMNELHQAGEAIQWVAFPAAGGDRWSIITDVGFQNRSVLAAAQAAMTLHMIQPGALRLVAYTPDGVGFSAVAHVPVVEITSRSASLSNVTSATLAVSGKNFDRVNQVTFDAQVITSKDSSDPTKAYYQVLSPTQIRVHPPQGLSLGSHQLTAASSWSTSDPMSVTLTKGSQAELLTPSSVSAAERFAIIVGAGPVLASQAVVVVSLSNLPSVAPGIASLGIGNAFTSFVAFPQPLSLSASSKSARVYLQSSPGFGRVRLYFQAMLLTPSLPWAVTTVGSTVFR